MELLSSESQNRVGTRGEGVEGLKKSGLWFPATRFVTI